MSRCTNVVIRANKRVVPTARLPTSARGRVPTQDTTSQAVAFSGIDTVDAGQRNTDPPASANSAPGFSIVPAGVVAVWGNLRPAAKDLAVALGAFMNRKKNEAVVSVKRLRERAGDLSTTGFDRGRQALVDANLLWVGEAERGHALAYRWTACALGVSPREGVPAHAQPSPRRGKGGPRGRKGLPPWWRQRIRAVVDDAGEMPADDAESRAWGVALGEGLADLTGTDLLRLVAYASDAYGLHPSTHRKDDPAGWLVTVLLSAKYGPTDGALAWAKEALSGPLPPGEVANAVAPRITPPTGTHISSTTVRTHPSSSFLKRSR